MSSVPREIIEQYAAESLDRDRVRFEAGDQYALMQAVSTCARYDIKMPEWVAVAFLSCFDAVHNYRSKSWDDVFGRPFPKGKKLTAARNKRIKMFRVYRAVLDIKRQFPDRPIDAGLFEEVASKFAIGKTLAEEYYYDSKKFLDNMLPQSPKTSRE